MNNIKPQNVTKNSPIIVDVWKWNLEEVFELVRKISNTHRYIAIDTEFPGVVAGYTGEFESAAHQQYEELKLNVDMLKLIQLGMVFFNDQGESPTTVTGFQFNFKYDRRKEMWADKSMDLLDNAGIDFNRHERDGIEHNAFAQLLIGSGVVLNDNITFISFHGAYDFGYLVKVLTNNVLPHTDRGFFELVRVIFPTIYDVRFLMVACRNLKGGLSRVASLLNISRYGTSHQAGSDSLLTGRVFFKIRNTFFDDHIDNDTYNGFIFGLGSCSIENSTRVYYSNERSIEPKDIHCFQPITDQSSFITQYSYLLSHNTLQDKNGANQPAS